MKKYYVLILFLLSTIGNHGYAQVISSLTPNSAMPGQTIDVAIRGINTHFQNGGSVADFGDGIIVKKFVAANSITGTATIQVNSTSSAGFRNVKVTTGSEVAEMDNGFELFSASGAFRANITLLPMESVSLKNIDLTQPKATPVLFFTNIFNDNVARKVNISITVSSSSKGLLGTMTLNNQSLNPNSIAKYTNREFTGVKVNGATGKAFLTEVEVTGNFPPDNYTYQLIVTDINGAVLATDESEMTITNRLTNPELILPGAAFTDEVVDEYNPLPLFQWFGQNDKYDFALYESRPGQTPVEAVRNIAVFSKKDISGNSFLYPNYAEKLIDGKVYAWQILAKAVTAGGIQYLPSEVFRFRYTTSGNTGKQLVASIKIVPEEITIASGGQQQFVVTCYDDNGALIKDVVPRWSVTPASGIITQTGLFTAGQGGNTVAVLVNAGTVTEFATVTVRMGITSGFKNPYEGFVKKLFGLK